MHTPWNNLTERFARGEMIIVHDHEREDEGDVFLLAEHVTPEKINWMLTHARGMICVACAPDVCNRLGLTYMVKENTNVHGTNFCTLIDAKEGITTGVSAFDRAQTISLMANPNTKPDAFTVPGHTAPLWAQDPHTRFGHTEASVELAKAVNAYPAVVICEILNPAGGKATEAEQSKMAEENDFAMTNITALRQHLLTFKAE